MDRMLNITRIALPIVLLVAGGAAFAADRDSERDAISAYLAKKEVVASQDLARQIGSSGHTTCYIAFVNGTARLDPGSYAQIREIAQMLKDERDLQIELSLHSTDLEVGSAATTLANQRAAVLAYVLQQMDISGKRVVAKRSTDPVAVAFNELVRRM